MSVLEEAGTQGMTTIVISHRSGVLAAVDTILFLRDGVIERLAPRAEFLAPAAAAASAPRIAAVNPGGPR